MGKKTPLARLRDPGTMFTDPDSDFHLSGNEAKPLPRRQGQVLKARITSGAIIVADDPPEKTEPPKAKSPGQMNKTELMEEVGKREGLGDKLAELAKKLGKDKPEDVPNKEIAALIIDFDEAAKKGEGAD